MWSGRKWELIHSVVITGNVWTPKSHKIDNRIHLCDHIIISKEHIITLFVRKYERFGSIMRYCTDIGNVKIR
jgi:hypothetical protein